MIARWEILEPERQGITKKGGLALVWWVGGGCRRVVVGRLPEFTDRSDSSKVPFHIIYSDMVLCPGFFNSWDMRSRANWGALAPSSFRLEFLSSSSFSSSFFSLSK